MKKNIRAVFGGDFNPHQTVLAQGTDIVEWELAGLVVMLCARRDFFTRDAAGDILQHQLLFAVSELHDSPAPFRRSVIVATPAKEVA